MTKIIPALDGTVQMTTRRLEVLWRLAFTDDVKWVERRVPIHRTRGYSQIVLVPTLDGHDIWFVMRKLKEQRLIRSKKPGEPNITPKGMAVLLDMVAV